MRVAAPQRTDWVLRQLQLLHPYYDDTQDMSTTILSYAGWAFLPNLVTGWLQSIYYGITVRAGDPKPQPGTPRYMKHKRRIHMIVIISYLCYTLYEADYWVQQQGDFYQALGVTSDVDEKAIKSRFRRL